MKPLSSVYGEKCYRYAANRGAMEASSTALIFNGLPATCEGAVTVPLTPSLPAPPTQPPQESFQFPLSWLLREASPPIQYRATIEVARLPLRDLPRFGLLPHSYAPAIALALAQRPDATWNGSMLQVPSARGDFLEVGTIGAVRRLLEYGWEREAPPLIHARRVLFRLLAEDEDPAYLYELAPTGKADPETARLGRHLLRDAAAATLAQAGYETDPRLRGAARRAMERLDAFLRSPLAAKPFVRSGNQHVLAPEAAPPTIYTLLMLAWMPLFRSEHYAVLEALYAYLSAPAPRQVPALKLGKRVVEQPHVILGDPLPHRNAVDADVPAALFWLELLARMGFLRRNEVWTKLFDRLLEDRDELGVWRPPRRSAVMRSSDPVVWPVFPLEPHPTPEDIQSNVTFRLGLIARYSGRVIDVV